VLQDDQILLWVHVFLLPAAIGGGPVVGCSWPSWGGGRRWACRGSSPDPVWK
jgi:hypothetical protein